MWYYKGEEFTSEMIGEYIGFVYLITDKSNGMKYVGKKLLKSVRKLPPLKGYKRRRTVIKESDKPFLETYISDKVSIKESAYAGLYVGDYEPDSQSHKEFKKLADELFKYFNI